MARIISDSPFSIEQAHRLGLAMASGWMYDDHKSARVPIDSHVIVHRDEFFDPRLYDETSVDRTTWFFSANLIPEGMGGWRHCQNPIYVDDRSGELHVTVSARGRTLLGHELTVLARTLVNIVDCIPDRAERFVALPSADFAQVAARVFIDHRAAIAERLSRHLARVLVSVVETFLFHQTTLG